MSKATENKKTEKSSDTSTPVSWVDGEGKLHSTAHPLQGLISPDYPIIEGVLPVSSSGCNITLTMSELSILMRGFNEGMLSPELAKRVKSIERFNALPEGTIQFIFNDFDIEQWKHFAVLLKTDSPKKYYLFFSSGLHNISVLSNSLLRESSHSEALFLRYVFSVESDSVRLDFGHRGFVASPMDL